MAGGTPVQVLENVESYNDLAIVNKGIYFITWQRGVPFQFLRFDTGTISPVGSVKSLLGLGLTISPDGKSLLYTQFDQSGSELMLVENFH